MTEILFIFILDILDMRKHLSILILLLCTISVHGQWFTVTNLSGTTAPYGTTNVSVLGGGSFSTYPGWCGAAPYWIGSGTGTVSVPGWYTFTFVPAATSIRIYTTASDPGESIAIKVNGVRYTLTAANLIAWASTCGTSTMTLSGDTLISVSGNSSSEIVLTFCPINSIEVETDGIMNGTVFTMMFSDSGSCFNALYNYPCWGDTLKLRGAGDSTGATYSWIGPAGFTSTLQNPFRYPAVYSDTGTYRVIKHIGTTYDTSYTHVLLHDKPTLILSSNAPLCTGLVDTLHLSALPDSVGETFSWTGPAGFTSTLEFPQINGFLPINVGTYTVIATTRFGCKDTGTVAATLAPVPPRPVISGTTVYCTGQPFVPFTVTATGTVLWYSTGTGGVGTGTPPIVNTAVAGTTIWWASQTILGCESLRDSIIVVVHPTPAAPVVTGATTYCQYFPYILPTVAGVNVLWYTTATGGTGSAITPTVNTNVPGVYNFWVTQTDTGCESARTPFTVTVNPKPIPPYVMDIPSHYCPGQPFVPFTVVTGTNILWYTTATGGSGNASSPVVNTNIPGTYTYWASQTVLGCESDRFEIVITVFDDVKAGFDYTTKFGCKADTVLFTNTSTGCTDYTWSFGDGTPLSQQTNPTHVYVLQGVNTVKLVSSSANCFDSVTQTIDLRHPLKAAFLADSTNICMGKKVTFSNGSIGTLPSYFWSFGDGTFSNVSNTSHTYPHTGIYKVFEVVTDFVPCTDTAWAIIEVDSISSIHMSITDTVLCRGTASTFIGKYSPIGNTGITWNMGNGDIIKDVNPLAYSYLTTGTFTVTASAGYRQCPDTSVSRRVTIMPSPSINLGKDTSICKGSIAFMLTDNINRYTNGASWQWNTGQTTSSILVTEPGEYVATVKVNGCTSSYTLKVINDCYMNIPNIFTPNGDGLNDYFFPRNALTSGLISFKMEIFNRWGQLVFQSTSTEGRGWDGKLNDTEQPEGVYIYTMEGTFKDGQKERHQGNVTLLR